MYRLQNPGRNPGKTNGLILTVSSPYIGRFAPSPTGPLHLGSLYTALASFLDARSRQGLWLLRIDDLDTPRNVTGATSAILNCLERFGLHWDGTVYYQSRHFDSYQNCLDQLSPYIYKCTCSRKRLENSAQIGEIGIYPGYCRTDPPTVNSDYALRIKTDHRVVCFDDLLQGPISARIDSHHGDFIIRRRDGIIAYQLAVVTDDREQGVNHVVRGCDLLDSTPKQLFLQQLLGIPAPVYLHLPVIVDADGNKLSKQTKAQAVESESTSPARTLFMLLKLLQQQPPPTLAKASVSALLDWAVAHWQPQHLKKMRAIRQPID